MAKIIGRTPDEKDAFLDIQNEIISFFDKNKFVKHFPQYQNGNFFNETLQKFIDLLWAEFEKSNDWKTALSTFEGNLSVPVMTIHKSKGLEFDCVYFVGLEDNSFFTFQRNRSEDICAFFVAVSRAKNELHFTRCLNRTSLNNNSGTQSITIIKSIHDAIESVVDIELYDHTSNADGVSVP